MAKVGCWATLHPKARLAKSVCDMRTHMLGGFEKVTGIILKLKYASKKT